MMRSLFCVICALLMGVCNVYAADYSYKQSQGVDFAWKTEDRAGVYTPASTCLDIRISSISEADNNQAVFYLNGWALSENTRYVAYYPYNYFNILVKNPQTALPATYTDQTQNGNDNLSHLSAYDFMTSQATATNDALAFRFNHLGCIVRVACCMPEETKVTAITLEAEDSEAQKDIFVSEATMDATNNVLSPKMMSSSVKLQMKNVTVAEGDSLIAYMMLVPQDYSNKLLSLQILNGSDSIATVKLEGAKLLSGKCYPVSLNARSAEKGETSGGQSKGLGMPTVNAAIQYPTGYAPDFPIDRENAIKKFVLRGDADDNGIVDAQDAQLIIEYYLGIIDEMASLEAADANGDGEITVADANEVLNKVLNR